MNRRAFSLVELMIVVAVLGILAAIVVPQFQEHSTQAKEAVAKDSLRIFRSAIELYAAQHSSVGPGYQNGQPGTAPNALEFTKQLITEGHYMLNMPENPFNNLDTIQVLGDEDTFPGDATGTFGWIYQPITKVIKLDWSGSDKYGVRYYDY